MGPIIRYLEKGMLEVGKIDNQVRSATQDFERVLTISDEIKDKYAKIEGLSKDCKLPELLVQDADSEKYEKSLQSLKYLQDLSEDTLWILYEPALSQPSSSRPFDDFTQHHRDLYLRLKLRSLDSKFSSKSHAPT
jgi:hypothetical protein